MPIPPRPTTPSIRCPANSTPAVSMCPVYRNRSNPTRVAGGARARPGLSIHDRRHPHTPHPHDARDRQLPGARERCARIGLVRARHHLVVAQQRLRALRGRRRHGGPQGHPRAGHVAPGGQGPLVRGRLHRHAETRPPRRLRRDDRRGRLLQRAPARHPALQRQRAMRCALLALLVLTGCASAPAQAPATHLIIRIADVSDCGGSGTTCPELTDVRRVRVGLDGSLEPFSGARYGVAPGAGPRPFGVRLRAGHLRVRRPGAPMKLTLRGFGAAPTLSWSPSGRRFSVLEDFNDARTDRVLIVDPGEGRSWRLRLRAPTKEIWALTWRDDERLIAETIDRHDYGHLATLDAVSGRVLVSQRVNDGFQAITWSPSARRLAVEDGDRGVGVLSVAHPLDITWTRLKGVPSWSPDGARILATGAGAPQLAIWPAGATIRLPRDLADAIWLPEGHALIGLLGTLTAFTDAPAQLVQLGGDGQVERIVPVRWPSRAHPDSLAPQAIPLRIEGLEPY